MCCRKFKYSNHQSGNERVLDEGKQTSAYPIQPSDAQRFHQLAQQPCQTVYDEKQQQEYHYPDHHRAYQIVCNGGYQIRFGVWAQPVGNQRRNKQADCIDKFLEEPAVQSDAYSYGQKGQNQNVVNVHSCLTEYPE